MSDTYTTKVIVLKRQSYRENDSLIVVYSQDKGKISLVARGTQKDNSKLRGHLEPMCLSNVMVIEGKGSYIGSALCLNAFLGIKEDLNKLYYSGQAIKLFNRMITEGEKDDELFKLLQQYLEVIDRDKEFEKNKGQILLSFFIIKLAIILGYTPNFYTCLRCERKIKQGDNYFNWQEGSLVDKECYQGKGEIKIRDNSIKLARLLIDNNLEYYSKIKVKEEISEELLNILLKFIAYQS